MVPFFDFDPHSKSGGKLTPGFHGLYLYRRLDLSQWEIGKYLCTSSSLCCTTNMMNNLSWTSVVKYIRCHLRDFGEIDDCVQFLNGASAEIRPFSVIMD